MLSFPRRQESSVFNSFLDTGFRRYDVKRSYAKLSDEQ
ncbi:MAG: hypothetical protein BWX52_01994 [Bacteroidetes bacterium ADurb.Bin013]|nr:MAG: hypothetical protein BWX52_01994 [Bacteroidetes bacterium ADurb.Bin013]